MKTTKLPLHALVRSMVWAIRPEALDLIAGAVKGEITAEQLQAELQPDTAAHEVTYVAQDERDEEHLLEGDEEIINKLAVIPLKGVLRASGGLLELLFGLGGGLKSFRQDLRAALADESVSQILIDVDSPGGSTDLIAETAAEVSAARERKPVAAIANTRAASAAYWIASQASELVVTPSGDIGSIGVFSLHEDFSKADEMAGIATTLIYAGRFKTEGNPYEPLSDEARKAIQQDVDDFYGLFVEDVAQGRGTSASAVKAGFGEGRLVTAARAVSLGMADRVDTVEATIARLVGEGAREVPAAQARFPRPDNKAKRVRELELMGARNRP